MTEILFYHLTERDLKATLPTLLERSLERGWRCVVQMREAQDVKAMDEHLWTFRDDSFIPHGYETNGFEGDQPVWLTCDKDNPNRANIRFLVDGAEPPDLSGYERGIYIFDGHNNEAVEAARARWKMEKEAGHDITYWQQNARGGWEKKA